jgi:hypothetical protein
MHDIDQGRDQEAETEIVDDLVREERFADEESELEHGGAGRFFAVAMAMRQALAGDDSLLEAQETALTPEERMAIELLRDAVVARTGQVSFIDAERREMLLNQALAVLQPALALGLVPAMGDGEVYGDLVSRVEHLRERLHSLADAQEEIIAEGKKPEEAEEGDEGDGDEGEEDADGEPDRPAPSTLFDGPELPAEKPAPSTLSVGPDAPAVQPARSTLFDGPEPEPEDDAGSTL